MARHSRRDFLKRTAVIGGAAALAPLSISVAEPAMAMAIARYRDGQGGPVDDNATVDARARTMTEQTIAALGGMGRFVKKGDVVWIKPNIAWDRRPEQAANTNPAVVATLTKLCLAAGAKKVKVGDRACNEAKRSYPRSGIEAAVKDAGGQMVYLDENRVKEYTIGGKELPTWPLFAEIVESDLVINVPIAKHHSISGTTLCMKNYMGVAGGNRGKWHQQLATCLSEITAFMKPRLSVLDATRIMTGNGPTGGNLADVKRMDTIAAGTDVVALDAFGAEVMGHKPEAVATVAAGAAAGLGQMDYRKLALREIDLT